MKLLSQNCLSGSDFRMKHLASGMSDPVNDTIALTPSRKFRMDMLTLRDITLAVSRFLQKGANQCSWTGDYWFRITI